MITRSALEALLTQYRKMRSQKEADANVALGTWNTFNARYRNGKKDEAKAQELWTNLQNATAEVHGYAGAMQAIQKLIQTCDMQVVDTSKLDVEYVERVEDGDKVKVSNN